MMPISVVEDKVFTVSQRKFVYSNRFLLESATILTLISIELFHCGL